MKDMHLAQAETPRHRDFAQISLLRLYTRHRDEGVITVRMLRLLSQRERCTVITKFLPRLVTGRLLRLLSQRERGTVMTGFLPRLMSLRLQPLQV